MGIYDRTTRAVAVEDKYGMFQIYIAKATQFFGVTSTRDDVLSKNTKHTWACESSHTCKTEAGTTRVLKGKSEIGRSVSQALQRIVIVATIPSLRCSVLGPTVKRCQKGAATLSHKNISPSSLKKSRAVLPEHQQSYRSGNSKF